MAKAEIEDILAGKVTPEESTPAPEPPKEAEREAVLADNQSQGQATEEKAPPDGGVSDSGADPSRQAAGMKAAYTAEKKKRQEIEQALDSLRKEAVERDQWYRQQSEQWQRQLQQFAPKPPDQPKPSMFDNPDDWEKQAVQQPIQSVEQRMRYHFSEMLARRFYKEEFDEAEKWAQAQVRQNPAHPIRQVLANSPDPGEDLVQEYRKQKQLAEMADPVAYRQKLLDEMLNDPEQKKAILEKLGAEPLKKAVQTPASALPSNLAGARSVGGSGGPVWQGPQPLTEIIGGNKKR